MPESRVRGTSLLGNRGKTVNNQAIFCGVQSVTDSAQAAFQTGGVRVATASFDRFVGITAAFVKRDRSDDFQNSAVRVLLPVLCDVVHGAEEANSRAVVADNRYPVVTAVFHEGFGELFIFFRRDCFKLALCDFNISIFADLFAGPAFDVADVQGAGRQGVIIGESNGGGVQRFATLVHAMKIYDYNVRKNLCGDRAREARARNRITQADLAVRLQVAEVIMERDSVSRIEIGTRFVTDYKLSVLSDVLGVCVKTVYNELERGKCVRQTSEYEFVERYCADVAERKYQENLREKGPEIKLGKDFAFVEYIENQIINKKRSPGAALAQIEVDGKEFDTHICETTLYNWIYRGDVFLNVTEEHLPYKGNHRKPEDRDRQKRARSAKGEPIEQRPQEVADRETFGTWEMDSIVGHKESKTALVVLTERLTRYLLIMRVPDYTMAGVVQVLDRIEHRMGAGFRTIFDSITVVSGCEFQYCEGMERAKRARKLRTKIYYCHPYSAYERGSNKNMNRIIRRFFPKGRILMK